MKCQKCGAEAMVHVTDVRNGVTTVSNCWMSLPKERRTLEELETQVRRMLDRALKDFQVDHGHS